jgi:hypothetical protein
VTGGLIKFGLTKIPHETPDGYSSESVKVAYVSHEIDVMNWENPTKYDEGNFKGLKFSRRSLVDSKGSKDEYF